MIPTSYRTDKSQFIKGKSLQRKAFTVFSLVYRCFAIEYLQVLQTKCKYILENRISIANLNIPKSFYSGDVLLLDNINNVKVLIDILDTLDESDTIYHNIKGLDFEILTSFP